MGGHDDKVGTQVDHGGRDDFERETGPDFLGDPPFQGKLLAERTQARARCPVPVIEVFAGLDLVGPRRATRQRRGFKRRE